ncbi:MAG TPA: antibiotic biosynthesis monooxygenase [Nocardioidaceae bacterium]|nr:antibiotic biosynthesis monooxygenase [Nocardioidaceae bacterium]
MYARTSMIQGDPAKADEAIAHVRDTVLPAVTAMPGCVGMSLLVDRGTGRAVATTAWESEEAMQATAEVVRPLRSGAEQILGGSASTVDTWEVSAVHRDHAVPDGACARVTWLHGEPGAVERAPDVFKMALLPKFQEMPGFCSASHMVDRAGGRWVGTVIFDSRQDLEASRDPAAALRQAATREIGATVDEVAEFEVALAHLHIPEMA